MVIRMKHDGFESREYPRGRERKRNMRNFRRRYARRAGSGGSMLAKMGICALLCGMVLLSQGLKQRDMAVSAAVNSEGEEYLGKLRFVELPGIIQVFAQGAKLDLGIEYSEHELLEDETLVRLHCEKGAVVSVPGEGRVKSAGNGMVELQLGRDIAISCKGLEKVSLEEGQPVQQGDTLGVASECLDVRIYKAGRPVNPAEYLKLNGGKV